MAEWVIKNGDEISLREGIVVADLRWKDMVIHPLELKAYELPDLDEAESAERDQAEEPAQGQPEPAQRDQTEPVGTLRERQLSAREAALLPGQRMPQKPPTLTQKLQKQLEGLNLAYNELLGERLIHRDMSDDDIEGYGRHLIEVMGREAAGYLATFIHEEPKKDDAEGAGTSALPLGTESPATS